MKPILLVFLGILFFGCGVSMFGRQANLDEPIELKTKESVSIRGTGVKLVLESTGREWVLDVNGRNGSERPRCEFIARFDGKEEKFTLRLGAPKEINNHLIAATSINPFGIGNCTIVVKHKDSTSTATSETQNDKDDNDLGVAFLSQYNWHVLDKPVEIPLDFPKELNGLPFFHYQRASESIGLDLNKVAGKNLPIRKYTLTETAPRSGGAMYAYLVFDNNEIVGAWLAANSPVTPGIASVKSSLSDLKNW